MSLADRMMNTLTVSIFVKNVHKCSIVTLIIACTGPKNYAFLCKLSLVENDKKFLLWAAPACLAIHGGIVDWFSFGASESSKPLEYPREDSAGTPIHFKFFRKLLDKHLEALNPHINTHSTRFITDTDITALGIFLEAVWTIHGTHGHHWAGL